MATAKEKRHMDRVAQLPCSVCGDSPVELHHIREGQGMSQKAGNYLVIPLCVKCHRSNIGLHGDRSMFKIMKKNELDCLNETIEKLL